jgi:hypothetical protein
MNLFEAVDPPLCLHMQSVSGAGLYALRSVSGLQSLNLSSCLELGDEDPLAALPYLTGTAATVCTTLHLTISRTASHSTPSLGNGPGPNCCHPACGTAGSHEALMPWLACHIVWVARAIDACSILELIH